MNRITNNIVFLEWVGLNILNVGTLGLIAHIPTVISVLVGISVITLNIVKTLKELKK